MIFINERKILMPFHDSIHEVRIALTVELFDASQAAFVDQMEVGKRVSGPVRLALSVQDVEAGTEMFQQAGALVLSQPKTMPWGDCNARVEPPDGMQITLYQTTPVRD